MSTNHVCQGNDHISSLTATAGFADWHTIWNANPELQNRRANPNMLFKGDRTAQGDVIKIPDVEEGRESGGTEAEHSFVVSSQKVFLRMRILKDDFTGVADADFELTIPGVAAPFTGKTNAQGQFEVEIPRNTQTATLAVRVPAGATDTSGGQAQEPPEDSFGGPRGPVPVVWQLQVGALNPIMQNAPNKWCIAGVQQRLNNLGLNTGPVDGILGPNTDKAVKAFQETFGLNPDGKPGQGETQPKLVEVHDKPDSILGPKPTPAAAPAGAAGGG
jgi:hypothetical protein